MDEKALVLAIDDNPQQLENFKLLIGQKYDLRVAEAASAAIAFLSKKKADVLLLDIEMPNVNGFEFIEDLKRLPSMKNTPIIIVSGNKDEAFFEKAKNSAAFDVLTKPVKQDTLIAAIEKALAYGKSQGPALTGSEAFRQE